MSVLRALRRVILFPWHACRSVYHTVRYAPSADFTPPFGAYLRQRRLTFAFWFHIRRCYYYAKAYVRRRPPVESARFDSVGDKEHIVNQVIPHNARQIADIYRWRTERLINVLRCVGDLDTRNAKVLVIGPRNEAELLLFATYGFRMENITGVDLFTYSPKIRIMDMHEMQFPDDSFDVVYNSFVLRYSDDVRRAAAEMVRVCREGALIATGLSYGRQSQMTGTPFERGLHDLYSYFEGNIKHIYWDEELNLSADAGNSVMLTTIFRITKGAAARPLEASARFGAIRLQREVDGTVSEVRNRVPASTISD